MTTANTPWRTLGDVPYSTWFDVLEAHKPTHYGNDAVRNVHDQLMYRSTWKAAQPHSALLLVLMLLESSGGWKSNRNDPIANRNPFSFRVKDYSNPDKPSGYVSFNDWKEAMEHAHDRLFEDDGWWAGRDNPYQDTETIADLLNVYAPKSDQNATDDMIERAVDYLDNWPRLGASVPPQYNYDNAKPINYRDWEVAEHMKYAGYIDPADHIIRALIIHSAYGTLVGTTSWFNGGNALTDWMVGNVFVDGETRDGELRRFNDPQGNRYAYASGKVDRPIEDAAKFLELFGPSPSAINMFTTAIERSNKSTNWPPVSDREHEQRVHVAAYYANLYGKYLYEKTGEHHLTCDSFPLIPSENNRSFLIYHSEVNYPKRNTCPDFEVRSTLPQFINDVRVLLSKWQLGTPHIPPEVPPDSMPEYEPPVVIEELQAYTGDDEHTAPAFIKRGKDVFVFVNDRVVAIQKTPRYQVANLDNVKVIGPDIEEGTEFAVLWLFFDEDGYAWYITPWWTRVFANDTKRVSDDA